MTPNFDRTFLVNAFRRILTGWHRCLVNTSDSGAVWDSPTGIRTENFLSKSGKQCDGVTRMLPALAAWAAQPDNSPELALDDNTVIRPLELLKNALTHATDPNHTDFWQFAPNHMNQRQVESSIVAWSLWLAREQLLPLLSKQQIANLQNWLASCTQYTDLFSNWTLFVATNHAARLALSNHGFSGDSDMLRQRLLASDETNAGDGWLWDVRFSGLDYYNFWVNASHHFYIHAMLPELRDPLLTRAVERSRQRLADLPYFIDGLGRNILFGRSLAYRWGWLSGLIAAIYTDQSPLPPGLARTMLAKNLHWWLEIGSLNEHGTLHERLAPHASDGSRQSYINSGHPYWGMQVFLCLALPHNHPFWTAPAEKLPVETSDYLIPRQGPGFIFQGLHASSEVRLFNTRNLNHKGQALYEKFVYSSAFPCNALPAPNHEGTCWDNQFALRLADGTHVSPADVLLVDTTDPYRLRFAWRFKHNDFIATVSTLITIDGDSYTTHHTFGTTGPVPAGAQWIEGGFPLARNLDQPLTITHTPTHATATAASKRITTTLVEGWQTLHDLTGSKTLYPSKQNVNILYPTSDHFLLTTPVTADQSPLSAHHSATIIG